MTEHVYELTTRWTGNLGQGTTAHRAYTRDYEVRAEGKPVILSSSDPARRGDASRYNPEDLLVAALSGCHLLWYLHLCASTGVVVVDYEDHPRGTMATGGDGGGAFTEVVLRPQVTVASESMVSTALELHALAHKRCFIANSVNFLVRHEPAVTSEDQ